MAAAYKYRKGLMEAAYGASETRLEEYFKSPVK